jgi:arylsulfatase A-like enzyme
MAFAACGEEPETATDRRPDIVLISVDTLRADATSIYSRIETTPNLAKLAERALVFERAIAASSRTAPSHASMMTGLYPRHHSIGSENGSSRLVGALTVAEQLRERGWKTAAFIGNVILDRKIGLDSGFDVYDDRLPTSERNRPAYFERTAPLTTEAATRWLSEERDERPYFLWVHYQDPHGPYTPPAPFDGMFDLGGSSSESPMPVLEGQFGAGGIPAYQALPGVTRLSDFRARYWGETRFADESLGHLLAAVERPETDRPLVILFTSDHGESFGEDGIFLGHGHATSPELAHVPLLIAAPGVEPGRTDRVAHHVDVAATLLESAGVPTASIQMDGQSLVSPSSREAGTAERVVFCDIGTEVSGYTSSSFVRARPNDSGVLEVSGHSWVVPDRWVETPASPRIVSALETYLAQEVPTTKALQPSREEIERLRSLGYVE